MTYKLYTVGSNQILADELKDALTSILQEHIPVYACPLGELTSKMDGILYVCNQSQMPHILRHISPEKVILLDMQPSAQFYLQITSVPAGSDIYVFNNRQPYIDSLIGRCCEMGLNQYHYIPVPYASLSEEVITHYLSEAEYIIGVDRILDAVLWSEKYRGCLRENVMTIGAKRVVSIESTCNMIKKVNETLFDYFTVQLDELLVSFHQAKHGETLYTHFKDLEQRLNAVREPLWPEKTTYKDKNMESIILRSAMSQLVANRDVRI